MSEILSFQRCFEFNSQAVGIDPRFGLKKVGPTPSPNG